MDARDRAITPLGLAARVLLVGALVGGLAACAQTGSGSTSSTDAVDAPGAAPSADLQAPSGEPDGEADTAPTEEGVDAAQPSSEAPDGDPVPVDGGAGAEGDPTALADTLGDTLGDSLGEDDAGAADATPPDSGTPPDPDTELDTGDPGSRAEDADDDPVDDADDDPVDDADDDADDGGEDGGDLDGDGIPDLVDVCPEVPDSAQGDVDGDGIGDACDPPPTPELSSVTPLGPANDNAPIVAGAGTPGHVVTLFGKADCSGAELASVALEIGAGMGAGEEGGFTQELGVQDDSVTALAASQANPAGLVSACAPGPIYVEDSTPPAAPLWTGSSPASPSASTSGVLHGQAEPGSSVTVFAGACSGEPLEAPALDADGGFSLALEVEEGGSLVLAAIATDEADNGSTCSEPFEFVHDAVPPSFLGAVGAEALSMTEAEVSWLPGEDEVSPEESLSYHVCASELRVVNGGCQPFVSAAISEPGAASVIISGLAPGRRHFFVARAADEAGNMDDNLEEVDALTPGEHSVKQVAAGGAHTCALMARGQVWCWGAGGEGQLGQGVAESSDTPVLVEDLAPAKLITAGGEHTCAALGDGSLRCWGRGDRGQLGQGTTSSSLSPVEVVGVGAVKAMSGGSGHTCALTGGGKVWCWGAGDRGQLGRGSLDDSPDAALVLDIELLKDLSAGGEHTCAVQADGRAWCWGAGDLGQLGDGAGVDRATPVEVEPAAEGLLYTDVEAGGRHTCARLGTGQTACWGDGSEGQIGSDPTPTSAVPVLVPDLPAITDLACGDAHSCVRLGDGTVSCWGRNTSGQMGTGSTSPSEAPGTVGDVEFTHHLNSLGDHTCVRRSDGVVICWGAGDQGQLGADGDSGGDATVVGGLVGLPGAIAVQGHKSSFYCALIVDGTVKCWGDEKAGDNEGSLGDGPPGEDLSPDSPWRFPVEVQGMDMVKTLGGALESACVIRGDGSLWCWGSSGYVSDELGYQPDVPMQVVEIDGAWRLGVGAHDGHCVIRASGDLSCFHQCANEFLPEGTKYKPYEVPTPGQVVTTGNLSTYGRATGLLHPNWHLDPFDPPGVLSTLDHVIHLDQWGDYSAIRADGSVWLWPLKVQALSDYKCCAYFEADSDEPTPIAGFVHAVWVQRHGTGSAPTFALASDGRVFGWGKAKNKALGDYPNSKWATYGKGDMPGTAIAIEGIEDVVSLGTIGYGACTLHADGTLSSWGSVPGDGVGFEPSGWEINVWPPVAYPELP